MSTSTNANLQSSTTLDDSVIPPSFVLVGAISAADQVASLDSPNNFINFCAAANLTSPPIELTDGKQLTTESCNPAPWGSVPAANKMPSAKFVFPQNGGKLAANTPFQVTIATRNLNTGNTANSQTNYLAAPQQLNSDGIIIGNLKVVIEEFSIEATSNPLRFSFFKGIPTPAVDGKVSTDVSIGLPPGTYKISTILATANHAPVMLPVLQRGNVNDAIFVTFTEDVTEVSSQAARSLPSSSVVRRESSAHRLRKLPMIRRDPIPVPARKFKRQSQTLEQRIGELERSKTLSPSTVAPGYAQNGQNPPNNGQVASLTSTNNFINYCASTRLPLISGGSSSTAFCNPSPMGMIPTNQLVPSTLIISPRTGATIAANTDFAIQIAVTNLVTGNAVNPDRKFLSAPQQLSSSNGMIMGHVFVVIEKLTALNQIEPLDPTQFSFFKSITGTAVGGTVSTTVTKGLDAGVYRASAVVSAANYQPILAPVLQRAVSDDVVYFTVFADPSKTSSAPSSSSSTGSPSSSAGSLGSTSSKPNTGLIAGVVSAIVVSLIILAIAVWLFLRQRKQRREAELRFDSHSVLTGASVMPTPFTMQQTESSSSPYISSYYGGDTVESSTPRDGQAMLAPPRRPRSPERRVQPLEGKHAPVASTVTSPQESEDDSRFTGQRSNTRSTRRTRRVSDVPSYHTVLD